MKITDIAAGIPPETLRTLESLDLELGRPLIAVDCDEVLVVFVDHLDRYIRTLGYEMRLVSYQLEGTMFPIGSDEPLPFDDCIDLINRFFDHETLNQKPVPGGIQALRRLSELAQIVILTNVPHHAAADRRANLDALGLDFPMVVNTGGKGRAMAWLAAMAGATTAFIDDSVNQIESVAKHAPQVVRLHFAAADFIRRLYPECPAATLQVHGWPACERALRDRLTGGD